MDVHISRGGPPFSRAALNSREAVMVAEARVAKEIGVVIVV